MADFFVFVSVCLLQVHQVCPPPQGMKNFYKNFFASHSYLIIDKKDWTEKLFYLPFWRLKSFNSLLVRRRQALRQPLQVCQPHQGNEKDVM